ncbi:hypothetical protein [Streptomyces sp. NPDC005385]|uniref:hypothetical protein n=1 Tax=Streptomyces sp. NPDC005385 TaxID=3157039 RepID=UPI0033B05029
MPELTARQRAQKERLAAKSAQADRAESLADAESADFERRLALVLAAEQSGRPVVLGDYFAERAHSE